MYVAFQHINSEAREDDGENTWYCERKLFTRSEYRLLKRGSTVEHDNCNFKYSSAMFQ